MQGSSVFVLLAAVILSRVIRERGYRKLEPDAKIRLMDGFSSFRAYSMVPIVILIGGYWFLVTKANMNHRALTVGYFGLLFAYVAIYSIWVQAKLATLEMPADYRRMFLTSQILSFLGIAWFFFAEFGRT